MTMIQIEQEKNYAIGSKEWLVKILETGVVKLYESNDCHIPHWDPSAPDFPQLTHALLIESPRHYDQHRTLLAWKDKNGVYKHDVKAAFTTHDPMSYDTGGKRLYWPLMLEEEARNLLNDICAHWVNAKTTDPNILVNFEIKA